MRLWKADDCSRGVQVLCEEYGLQIYVIDADQGGTFDEVPTVTLYKPAKGDTRVEHSMVLMCLQHVSAVAHDVPKEGHCQAVLQLAPMRLRHNIDNVFHLLPGDAGEGRVAP